MITKQYGAEFEAENSDSLAAALSKELATPKDEELLKQEMEYVKENFDYDAVIEWHEDVYKCALNRKMKEALGAKLLMKKQDVQISIIVPIYKVESILSGV